MIIALVGDSTVTAESGWGAAFAGRFGATVRVLNFAAGGRSSRSFHDEGRLPAVLTARPDFVLIQFGHNDQPGKGPERETDPATSFRDFLRLYVTAARGIGAVPVLISSLCRRQFDAEGRIRSTLTPWAEATRAVAGELAAPFVDLHADSLSLHDRLGPEASMAFNLASDDLTHLNTAGAEAIADLVLQRLAALVPALATGVRLSTPAPLHAAGVAARNVS